MPGKVFKMDQELEKYKPKVPTRRNILSAPVTARLPKPTRAGLTDGGHMSTATATAACWAVPATRHPAQWRGMTPSRVRKGAGEATAGNCENTSVRSVVPPARGGGGGGDISYWAHYVRTVRGCGGARGVGGGRRRWVVTRASPSGKSVLTSRLGWNVCYGRRDQLKQISDVQALAFFEPVNPLLDP